MAFSEANGNFGIASGGHFINFASENATGQVKIFGSHFDFSEKWKFWHMLAAIMNFFFLTPLTSVTNLA